MFSRGFTIDWFATMSAENLHVLNCDCLPVRRSRTPFSKVMFHQLTENIAEDPIIDIAWFRADLRLASLELLIGLLATACPPENTDAWMEWWNHPPTPEMLATSFAPLAAAFILDGDGPLFCQDFEDFEGESIAIERLLIDAPGENTVKRNTDLVVKRDSVAVLGRAAAAMALYALQAFAPSGGAGHRTSLRGGGPLTTLVSPRSPLPDHPRTLWHTLWANVPCGRHPAAADLPLVFPWLAPTRRSEGNVGTTPGSSEAHALQVFWGMPRRIRLDLRPAKPGEVCGLTGMADSMIVTGFRTRPWGVQYTNKEFPHPLTPTYTPKPGQLALPVHPQPDGIGYRHWSAMVAPGETDKSAPAQAVMTFLGRKPWRRGRIWDEATLLVGGYDMDNMKARAFVEAEMPLFLIEDDELRRHFLAFARDMAESATEVAGMLRSQLRTALRIEAGDAAVIDSARLRLFEDTTPSFWRTLKDALGIGARLTAAQRSATATAWLSTLRHHALALFDEAAPLDPLSPDAAGRMSGGKWEPPPVVQARKNLGLGLAGYGKAGEALFSKLALDLPVKPKKAKGTRRG
jgi:CRISPR system Cascade subunit CasA